MIARAKMFCKGLNDLPESTPAMLERYYRGLEDLEEELTEKFGDLGDDALYSSTAGMFEKEKREVLKEIARQRIAQIHPKPKPRLPRLPKFGRGR